MDDSTGQTPRAVIWKFDGKNISKPILLPLPEGYSNYVAGGSYSGVRVSRDGNVVGGALGKENDDYSLPIIWRAKDNSRTNWEATLLKPLETNATGETWFDKQNQINTFNHNGNIAAGNSGGNAAVWRFNNGKWDAPISLGKGIITSSNANGDLLGGFTVVDNKTLAQPPYGIPTLWSGENYTNVSYLKTPDGTDSEGRVQAISANGNVATGSIHINDIRKAVIWVGKDKKAHFLDFVLPHDDAESEARAMTDDGSIIVGNMSYPYEYEDGTTTSSLWHTMAWVIKYNKEGNLEKITPVSKKEPVPDIEDIIGIDLTFTQKALQTLANDSIKLLGMQHYGLWRLQQGCYTEQTGFCYAVRNDYSNYAGIKDFTSGLTLGYQFGDGLLAGFNLDHSIYRQLPTSYKRSHSNLGMGLFARWQKDNWYVAPAMAWDYYDVKVKRPQLTNTESEERTSRVHGFGLSLTLGQDFALKNNTKLGWYATLSHTKISRAQFSEKEVALPISFASMTLAENALALGLNLEMPIKDKLTFLAGVRVEQQLSAKSPIYQWESKLGKQQFEAKLNRTRGKLNVGLRYEVNPNFNIEFSPYVEQSIFDKKRYGAQLNFSGRF